MENLVKMRGSFAGRFFGKSVFVTGHTGFKGAWLCEWLYQLGAKVIGYSKPPLTEPALFKQLNLGSRVEGHIGDVRALPKLRRAILNAKPDFVFHLAAQPLVRESYVTPVETFETNIIGTVNVLESLRDIKSPCVAIFITTDKCYENREWPYGYREEDSLGGHDPYSASKAAAEIAISSYRRSYFTNHLVKIASARAGNVIGGGDWAMDRIVPDCIRSLKAGDTINVRNPRATRPWQHVLEPLSGYLWLAARLSQPSTINPQLCSAFNFGPNTDSNRDVSELVEEILKHWPGKWIDQSTANAVHEARLLHLATGKAHHLLGWRPVWDFSANVAETIRWYRDARSQATAVRILRGQIAGYTAAAIAKKLPWATSNTILNTDH